MRFWEVGKDLLPAMEMGHSFLDLDMGCLLPWGTPLRPHREGHPHAGPGDSCADDRGSQPTIDSAPAVRDREGRLPQDIRL